MNVNAERYFVCQHEGSVCGTDTVMLSENSSVHIAKPEVHNVN